MADSTTTRQPAGGDRERIGDEQQQAVAPGWYPDPRAPGQQRWWDGGRWTEHLHPQPDDARRTLENRATVDDPKGAARVTFTFSAAVVTAGLMAGLFFFNASVVMPALADVDDRTFVEVMDKINDAVYNPLFFAVMFGAPVLIAFVAVQQRRDENPRAARWAWAALALYVASLILTMAVNVPLTDELVAAEPSNAGELAEVRDDFEGPFNAADIVRTVLHTAAVACLAVVPSRRLANGRHDKYDLPANRTSQP